MITLKVTLKTAEEPLIFEDLSPYLSSFTVSTSHLDNGNRMAFYLNKTYPTSSNKYAVADSLKDVWDFFLQFTYPEIQLLEVYENEELKFSLNGDLI